MNDMEATTRTGGAAAGSPSVNRIYVVHYQRKDGTEASGHAERNDLGGWSWLAPEDCVTITGITQIGGGGASIGGECSAQGSARETLTWTGVVGGPAAPDNPGISDEIAALRLLLAEKDAEIARLTAELDQSREVPVELVTVAGLQAAMTADTDRQDGTILRVTDGDRQAWQWKTRTGEWERIR